jgi:hypothetical protein
LHTQHFARTLAAIVHSGFSMTVKILLTGIYLAALLTPMMATAQSYDHDELVLFQNIARQPSDWARFIYLSHAVPHLSISEQILGEQLLSSSESELGLYDQAILGFPLRSEAIPNLPLPTTADWQAADAADAITALSSRRRIVLINEAHHDANTRVLTLALLPRLRALGFNYFAAEALSDKDHELMRRGYPVQQSGTEYLHEPLYGDMVREAIRLGFIIVPYDSSASGKAREAEQENNLYQRVFAKDSGARLFVHCDYAHIDKAEGRLGDIKPMAMGLKKLTGFDPLSIDQTQFLEVLADRTDAYHQLIASFHPKSPIILVNRTSGSPWSAAPTLYDVNVILPLSVSLKSFGVASEDKHEGDSSRLSHDLMNSRDMHRPNWLTLSGDRSAMPISADLCRKHFPCIVEARYVDESDDAIAADRYVFFEPLTDSRLYLRPGRYRLRTMDSDSEVLSEQTIQASK